MAVWDDPTSITIAALVYRVFPNLLGTESASLLCFSSYIDVPNKCLVRCCFIRGMISTNISFFTLFFFINLDG